MARDCWLSYGVDGWTQHDTAAEAQRAAEDELADYRNEAGEGWPDEAATVCWGRFSAHAVVEECDIQDVEALRATGDPDDAERADEIAAAGFDSWSDFQLRQTAAGADSGVAE